MQPELEAERQVRAIEAASVPHMTDSARKSVLDRYANRRRRTGGGQARARTLVEALTQAGVPVVDEPTEKQR